MRFTVKVQRVITQERTVEVEADNAIDAEDSARLQAVHWTLLDMGVTKVQNIHVAMARPMPPVGNLNLARKMGHQDALAGVDLHPLAMGPGDLYKHFYGDEPQDRDEEDEATNLYTAYAQGHDAAEAAAAYTVAVIGHEGHELGRLGLFQTEQEATDYRNDYADGLEARLAAGGSIVADVVVVRIAL
jgi:hypothetical protein